MGGVLGVRGEHKPCPDPRVISTLAPPFHDSLPEQEFHLRIEAAHVLVRPLAQFVVQLRGEPQEDRLPGRPAGGRPELVRLLPFVGHGQL